MSTPDLAGYVALGSNPGVLAAAARVEHSDLDSLGRVARVDRNAIRVIDARTGEDHSIDRAVVADQDWVTGDWVWRRTDTVRQQIALVPRLNELARSRGNGNRQVLVSNVDFALLVVPATEATRESVLERLAVIGWDSGAVPHFVITKIDLVDSGARERIASSIARNTPGVSCAFTSGLTMDGVSELLGTLGENSTSVLIGHSGVGKSTLINSMVGSTNRTTREVRDRDLKGRHTTTAREIVTIPGSASVIIDTPGVRELGIPDDVRALGEVFLELDEIARECRFADCDHVADPGCAIALAASDGTVSAERVERYLRLQREMQFVAGKRQPQRRDKSKEYTRFARDYRQARGDDRR